jgi:glycosyltransferase involved in cell wall biosynthesis
VGEGPARRSLESLARRLGVGHRIEFRGRVPHAEIGRLLETAPAAVFAGLREEGGVALAEAMLCGVPAIVLAHGGARTVALDAVDARRVALVPPGSADEVARGIGEAMTRFCADRVSATGPNLDRGRTLSRLEAACRLALAASHKTTGAVPPLAERSPAP